VTSADGDAGDLARLVLSYGNAAGGRFLYLAGADRAADVAGDLRQSGLAADTVEIYRAVAADSFPDPIRIALSAGKLDGVLHLSRRTADAYLNCARRDGLLDRALVPKHYCLSTQVAEPLVAAGARDITIATRPDEAALVERLAP
jgi:uroporphyrinogen-III synthase